MYKRQQYRPAVKVECVNNVLDEFYSVYNDAKTDFHNDGIVSEELLQNLERQVSKLNGIIHEEGRNSAAIKDRVVMDKEKEIVDPNDLMNDPDLIRWDNDCEDFLKPVRDAFNRGTRLIGKLKRALSASDYQYQSIFTEGRRNEVIWKVYQIRDEILNNDIDKLGLREYYIDELKSLIRLLKSMIDIEFEGASTVGNKIGLDNEPLAHRLEEDSNNVIDPLRDALESARSLIFKLLNGRL